jgi:ceramide glucosyltransferase
MEIRRWRKLRGWWRSIKYETETNPRRAEWRGTARHDDGALMIEFVLLAIGALSIVLNLWQWRAGRSFPIWKERPVTGQLPRLSVLKPLNGTDSHAEACLRSWFEQKYPAELELLFGVADENDPACDAVRRLAPQFPERPAKLVICHPALGANAKVSSLCHLAGVARHEILVTSDDDVEIPPGFLEQLVQPLTQGFALVNCFYILRPLNAAMAIESVAVNSDFWTQVLQRKSLKPMDFALGAVIATSQTELQKIGGFEPLVDYLADDYELGHRIAKGGGKLGICPIPVTCWTEEQPWRKVWNHQLRWARTIRACQPAPYFFSILNNATLWPLLALAAAPGSPAAQTLMPAALLLRALTATANHRRLARDFGWLAFGLAAIKDLLGAIIWALAFLGNTVTWRDRRLHVDRGGKLTPMA